MDWNELKDHAVKVYSTPWCGDCRRLKQLFSDKSVEFTEVDIDADQDAASDLFGKTGKKAIPYVEIDGEHLIRGWHVELPSRWEDQLFFDEINEALKN